LEFDVRTLVFSCHPGGNFLKLFCPSFTKFRNKLECLSLASLSWLA
jgi:hypothetical protein